MIAPGEVDANTSFRHVWPWAIAAYPTLLCRTADHAATFEIKFCAFSGRIGLDRVGQGEIYPRIDRAPSDGAFAAGIGVSGNFRTRENKEKCQ